MNPHSEVSDTSEKRATLNMYLRTYWELLQSGRKGAGRQYVKTVVAQAWLNKFTTNSSDSTLKLLSHWSNFGSYINNNSLTAIVQMV